MTGPFRYRPPAGGDDDWEDNRLSNALAWASATFLPRWCQTEQHWTSRFAATLFTTCPCCMIFRGLTLGFFLGLVYGVAFMGLLWMTI